MALSPALSPSPARLALAAVISLSLVGVACSDGGAPAVSSSTTVSPPTTMPEPATTRAGGGEPIVIEDDDAIFTDLDGWSESTEGVAEARGAVQRANLGGYELAYPGLGLDARYTVHMVDDHPDWMEIHEEVIAAAAELSYVTGVTFEMGPNVAAQTTTFGQITVQVASTSPCGPLSDPGTVGCGAGTSTMGRTVYGNIWVCECIAGRPDAYATVVHEFGHAAGLAHFEEDYEGQPQVMFPFHLPGMERLRSGDVNGLRKLTANGIGAGSAPNHPPGPVSALQVTGSFGAVQATWPAVPAYGRAVDRHEVQVESVSAGGTKTESVGPARRATISVTGGATYRARVRAHNSEGWGPWSPWSASVVVEGRCLRSIVDVPETSLFCEDITWLLAEDIASGFDDGTFRPGATVTRQAMAAFLMTNAERLAPGSVVEPAAGAPATSTFSDVPADHPFHDEIAWLTSTGITTGFPDGTFKPGHPVNRASMAAMLQRFSEHLDPGSTAGNWSASPFRDVPPDKPFHDEITWLDATGIASGFPDGTFRPDEPVSRQAMAAFLQRHDETNG